MQNNFVPIHLKQANANLDKHLLVPKIENKHTYRHKNKSLWQKILGLFKT